MRRQQEREQRRREQEDKRRIEEMDRRRKEEEERRRAEDEKRRNDREQVRFKIYFLRRMSWMYQAWTLLRAAARLSISHHQSEMETAHRM